MVIGENYTMTLISVEFALLLIATAFIYFIFPLKYRWTVLLLSSLVFYFSGGLGTGYFMIFGAVTIWIIALILDKYNEKVQNHLKQNPDLTRAEKKEFKTAIQKKKRLILTIGLVICFSFLIFLKYFNFLSEQSTGLLNMFGLNITAPKHDLALPLGISFYTLQATSYIIDVYRGKIRAERNFFKIALFVSFFPQIVQGPIGRFGKLAPQLFEGHKFEFKNFKFGLQLALWGIIKKLTLAEYMGIIADEIFNNYTNYSGLIILLGAMIYGVQVYADFSGGMDMVRGVAQIFGIEMAVNFERPYFSRSVSEFWRRWHITLGAWMKDYVFYPLSLSKAFASIGTKTRKLFGNYVGKMLPTFLASFIAFFLVGVWHGSDNKYVAYGLWNSIIISGSILLDSTYKKVLSRLKINTDCFSWKLFQILRTFFLVSIGRIFSRGNSLDDALAMLKSMFSEFNPWVLTDGSIYNLGLHPKELFMLFIMILILFVVSLMHEKGIKIRETLEKQNVIFQWIIIIGAIIFVLIYGAYGGDFNAADFVYQQF